MASSDRRNEGRVKFERGIPAFMMAIDGTWRRNCTMDDISEVGAKLTMEGSVEGLHLKEFFLLLSSTGLAYRRCELSLGQWRPDRGQLHQAGRHEEKACAADRGRGVRAGLTTVISAR